MLAGQLQKVCSTASFLPWLVSMKPCAHDLAFSLQQFIAFWALHDDFWFSLQFVFHLGVGSCSNVCSRPYSTSGGFSGVQHFIDVPNGCVPSRTWAFPSFNGSRRQNGWCGECMTASWVSCHPVFSAMWCALSWIRLSWRFDFQVSQK